MSTVTERYWGRQMRLSYQSLHGETIHSYGKEFKREEPKRARSSGDQRFVASSRGSDADDFGGTQRGCGTEDSRIWGRFLPKQTAAGGWAAVAKKPAM